MAQIAADAMLQGFTSTLLTLAFKVLFLDHGEKKSFKVVTLKCNVQGVKLQKLFFINGRGKEGEKETNKNPLTPETTKQVSIGIELYKKGSGFNFEFRHR